MVIRIILAAAAFIVIFYAVIAAKKFLNQSKYIYFPSRDMGPTPQDIGLDYEDLFFYTEDHIKINGWFVPARKKRPTLLFLHGNGGNISHRLELIQLLHHEGLPVLIIDYRGYGKSQGQPTERGTYLDAQAAMDYLEYQKGILPQDVVVYGRSLGGPIAARLAAAKNPAGLILDSTFTSIKDLGAELYPLLPVRRFLRFSYDTVHFIAKVQCPLLIIHSREDKYVPYHHAQDLYAKAKTQKDLLTIKGGHNDGFLVSAAAYRQKLHHFITGKK